MNMWQFVCIVYSIKPIKVLKMMKGKLFKQTEELKNKKAQTPQGV